MAQLPQSKIMLQNTRHYSIACYDIKDRRRKNAEYKVVTYNFIGTLKLCKKSVMFIQNKYMTQCFCFEKAEEFEIQKNVHF